MSSESANMFKFVLEHAPDYWEECTYNESFILFDLVESSEEYENVAAFFRSEQVNIKSIKRVQQPYQYGRFKIRQEMLGTHSVEYPVFHAIHPEDQYVALKFTCDYRRYKHKASYSHHSDKQPKFFHTVNDAINISDHYYTTMYGHFTTVLVVCKISGTTKTQSDYFIQYVVETVKTS